MDLYDEYKDLRDAFAIVTIHDDSVKNFAELDRKLDRIKKAFWKGRDLPFPILIDDADKTVRAYGVEWFPTTVLIDPEGKIVAGYGEALFEAKLKELRARRRGKKKAGTSSGGP